MNFVTAAGVIILIIIIVFFLLYEISDRYRDSMLNGDDFPGKSFELDKEKQKHIDALENEAKKSWKKINGD